MTAKKTRTLAVPRATDLRGSPLGNLLLEDAAASKQHGRTTARVGVGPDGNPIVYSTDVATREAVVQAIQQRAHVNFMDIPEVSEHDFRKLLRDGTRALDGRSVQIEPEDDNDRATRILAVKVPGDKDVWVPRFSLTIRKGSETIYEGSFNKVTDAWEAMQEHGEPGWEATIYDLGKIAQYRGGRGVFKFGRTKWTRA
jgi:hypothetical protein